MRAAEEGSPVATASTASPAISAAASSSATPSTSSSPSPAPSPDLAATLALARSLQSSINSQLTHAEKSFHAKMKKMLARPQSKVMLIELLDRSFRSQAPHAAYELISHTLAKHGLADFFSPLERTLLWLFLGLGKFAPSVSVPLFIKNLRSQTQDLVLDAEPLRLQKHALKRARQGIGLNVNLIGEEVLGQLEANYRLQKYTDALNSTYINYISIKITTIFSQINPLDFDYSKQQIVERLDRLYALAEKRGRQGFEKFINLDMEEFKDLELTVAAFMESIAKFDISAGIVLQAYLPDSFDYLVRLVEFSRERVASGKPPIKIRIVKGANMEAELALASLKSWPCPTFTRKILTDANYNKMLSYVLENERFKSVKIGIASHNIFQIAHALTRIKATPEAAPAFTFEMLEGMNLRASFELAKSAQLVLYAPVCEAAHFNNAIAYLIRRLDENTAEDNFMRHAFGLEVGSPEWKRQEEAFLASLREVEGLKNESFKTQNRLIECGEGGADSGFANEGRGRDEKASLETFTNEPDTDFTLAANRAWARQIKEKFQNLPLLKITPIIGESDLRVGGGVGDSGGGDSTDLGGVKGRGLDEIRAIFEKAQGKKIAELSLAGQGQIREAIAFLKDSKRHLSFEELGQILLRTAEVVAKRRGDLIGIAALEVGKSFAESDAEVSEAIDFLRFYPHSLAKIRKAHPQAKLAPLGLGAVITPWNFPVAISVGGIAAALATGNRVLYKPSRLSTATGLFVAECFFEAGLPRDYLAFIPASGEALNEALGEVDFVIFTGGEEAAGRILARHPRLFLSAETGGKNATIVSKMSDRDQAVKNIIHSAFSNSGQKCSATSLLILEAEVYDDANFKKSLIDAAASLAVGSPFDLKNKLGFLSEKLGEKAKRGLELAPGEEWALAPSFADENDFAMRPAIKYGVSEGSYSHLTEFFAPILSVMRARDLPHAVAIANSTPYGLTAGLESLDEREWEYFLENMRAGNLYINKPTTGAIVLRQPFGGVKKSAIGFGRKAGGYNYVAQFLRVEDSEISGGGDSGNSSGGDSKRPEKGHAIVDKFASLLGEAEEKFKNEIQAAIKRAKNYAYFYENEFAARRDFVGIRGEENDFFYRGVGSVIYRVSGGDALLDILSIIAACEISRAALTLSFRPTELSPALGFVLEKLKKLKLNVSLEYQAVEDFAKIAGDFGLIRYLGDSGGVLGRDKDEGGVSGRGRDEDESEKIYSALITQGLSGGKLIASHRPHANGYFELLYYFYELSASVCFHRYGNLGARGSTGE